MAEQNMKCPKCEKGSLVPTRYYYRPEVGGIEKQGVPIFSCEAENCGVWFAIDLTDSDGVFELPGTGKGQDLITKQVEMIETKVFVPHLVNTKTGKANPVRGAELELHYSLLEKGLMLSVPGDPNSEKVPYKA